MTEEREKEERKKLQHPLHSSNPWALRVPGTP
jgi:hypothetical protein